MSPSEQEPNVTQAVPFFEVSDIQESLTFYRDGLGFRIADEWIDEGVLRWCWLELGKAAVMLQEFETKRKTTRPDEESGFAMYFICNDALKIYRDAVARGLSPDEPFVGNRMWVTAFRDPDGYQLAFESLTDVPEGTRLSDTAPD